MREARKPGAYLSAYRFCAKAAWFSPPPKTYSFLETYPIKGKIQVGLKETNQPVIPETKEKTDNLFSTHEIEEVSLSGKRGKDLVYDVERDRDKAIDEGKSYEDNAHYYLVRKNNGYLFKSALEDVPDNTIASAGSWWWGNYGFFLHYATPDGKGKDLRKDHRYPDFRGSVVSFINLEEIQKIVIREWDRTTIAQGNELYINITGYLYPYEGTVYSPFRKLPDYRVASFDGYSIVKDFYSGIPEREDYIPGKSEHSRTLYWNPNLQTDKEGKVQVSFYNNAFCREISVRAEGISKEGSPVNNQNIH